MSGKRLPAAERLRRILRRVRERNLRLLVLGIGNELLGDDAIGHLVAEDLAALAHEGFLSAPVGVAIENAGPLIRRHRPDTVVLIDAATGVGRAPWGFVSTSRLDSFCHSTHSVPLSLLVAAWRDERPDLDVHFVGVRPHGSGFGSGLSPAVAAARSEIAAVFREVYSAPAEEQRG